MLEVFGAEGAEPELEEHAGLGGYVPEVRVVRVDEVGVVPYDTVVEREEAARDHVDGLLRGAAHGGDPGDEVLRFHLLDVYIAELPRDALVLRDVHRPPLAVRYVREYGGAVIIGDGRPPDEVLRLHAQPGVRAQEAFLDRRLIGAFVHQRAVDGHASHGQVGHARIEGLHLGVEGSGILAAEGPDSDYSDIIYRELRGALGRVGGPSAEDEHIAFGGGLLREPGQFRGEPFGLGVADPVYGDHTDAVQVGGELIERLPERSGLGRALPGACPDRFRDGVDDLLIRFCQVHDSGTKLGRCIGNRSGALCDRFEALRCCLSGCMLCIDLINHIASYLNHIGDGGGKLIQHGCNLAGCLTGLICHLGHLCSNNGEALSGLTGSCSFDGSVQGEHGSLLGDGTNHIDHRGDTLHICLKLAELTGYFLTGGDGIFNLRYEGIDVPGTFANSLLSVLDAGEDEVGSFLYFVNAGLNVTGQCNLTLYSFCGIGSTGVNFAHGFFGCIGCIIELEHLSTDGRDVLGHLVGYIKSECHGLLGLPGLFSDDINTDVAVLLHQSCNEGHVDADHNHNEKLNLDRYGVLCHGVGAVGKEYDDLDDVDTDACEGNLHNELPIVIDQNHNEHRKNIYEYEVVGCRQQDEGVEGTVTYG